MRRSDIAHMPQSRGRIGAVTHAAVDEHAIPKAIRHKAGADKGSVKGLPIGAWNMWMRKVKPG